MRLLSLLFLLCLGAEHIEASSAEALQDNSVYDNPADPDWVEPNGDTLKVRRKYSASYSRKAWIQFDLSGLQYNPGANAVFSITFLGMNFTPASGDVLVISALGSGFEPQAGVLGADWDETAVTWHNAPGNNTDSSSLLDAGVTSDIAQLDLNSVSLLDGEVLEFSIDSIGDYVQSNGTVTVVLFLKSYGDGKECSFASSENGIYSGPTLFVDNIPPSKPSNIEVEDLSESSTRITWTASSDDVAVKNYKVYRDGTCINTTAATAVDDTGLSKHSSYEYTVEACDTSDNVSERSDVLQRGYRRFPFFIPLTAFANDIADMSGLSLSPASTYVTASGGDLYTNGDPIRFLGVNLAGQACFPSHAVADMFAVHLAKMGVNCVRLHDIDRMEPYGLFDSLPTTDPGYMIDLDSGQLEKFDYLISRFKAAGIYVDLQLHKSRIYPGMPTDGAKKYFQGTDIYYPDMITLQKDFAYTLLSHTNAYTGNPYKDEPAVAFIEINNENGLIHEWCRGLFGVALHQDYVDELARQWRSWLAANYTNTATLTDAWLPSGGYPYNEEVLANGSFSSGTGNWTVQVTSPAVASYSIKDSVASDGSNALEIEIAAPGTYGWHVQCYQAGLHIVRDVPYTVSFWAKAETARNVSAKLQKSVTPYTVYGEPADFEIDTEWKEYKFVVVPSASDPNARFSITNLGLDAGKVWIANCSVRQGNTMLSSETSAMEQLSANELIANGEFSSGTGWWNVYILSPAAGSYGVEYNSGPNSENVLTINVTAADTTDPWRARFYQLLSSVTAGQPYILSFWAKADSARTVTVGLYSDSSPWNIAELQEVVIGTQWKEYRVVVCPDITENNVRVNFTDLAAETGQVSFTGISLTTGIRGLKPGETLWGMGIFDLAEFSTRTRAAQKDWMRFLWETESGYFTEMKNYVKTTIGAHGLVIGSQTYFSPALIQSDMDVVDTHFYLGHPVNSGDPEGWYFYNYSMAGRNGFNFAGRNAPLSIADKPFVCTEYNHPNPNTYGGETYLLAAAYASLQKWDAVFAFNYYSFPSTTPSEYFHHYYSICQEPVKLVAFPAAAAMLRRGDVARPSSVWGATLSVEDVLDKIIQNGVEGVGADDFGLSALHALQHPLAIEKGNQTRLVNSVEPLPDVLTSETGEHVWNSTNGLVYLKSPKCKAVIGMAGRQSHDLGDGVTVTTAAAMQPGDWAAISLFVKEGESFVSAGSRLLISAVGYTDNTHMTWKTGMGPEAFSLEGGASSVGSGWGKPSVLVEGMTASIALDNVSANDVQVWSLDENGTRAAPLAVTDAGGAAVFALNNTFKTIWYEVEIIH